jgi:hypothetical protein
MLEAVWFVLAGTGLVFLTLGFLLLVMIGLTRWLKPKA